ncbi:glycosyltransferase [Mangrovimonas sp. TPBH4]|uniref:glycosyltransferase n=1 Tax=Mangrovimonas sp. TPBH4 TaxID=1645914 RepID=UPI0006B55F8E|nr:glycosyltransferase [Mangrovimonas sp. TPBH4]
MNILIVLPNDTLGGAEQYLKMVADYFRNENVFICFLNQFNKGHWEDLSNNVQLIGLSTKSMAHGVLKLISFAINKPIVYDYIFTSHLYVNAMVGSLLSFGILKTQMFVARESTSVFPRYRGFKLSSYKLSYALGYRNMDLLICQTDKMKTQLLENVGYLQNRVPIETVPNPINLSVLKKMGEEELNFRFPKEYIVSAGRFIPEKGFDLLIKSFSEIKKQFPALKLIILGDGPLKEQLNNEVDKLNLSKDVIFTGFVNNVHPFFKHAKLCVVSSRLEGFPNVLLQMMSQNKHVVSTKCAGGIEDIEGVIKSETNSQESLTNAILEGLSNWNNTEGEIGFNNYLEERDIKKFMVNILKKHLNE